MWRNSSRSARTDPVRNSPENDRSTQRSRRLATRHRFRLADLLSDNELARLQPFLAQPLQQRQLLRRDRDGRERLDAEQAQELAGRGAHRREGHQNGDSHDQGQTNGCDSTC